MLTINTLVIAVFIGIIILFNYNLFPQVVFNSFIDKLAKYGFYLRDIQVSGHKNVSLDFIKSVLNVNTGIPIFFININHIRVQLENIDWIEKAVVVRQLPNALYINVNERIPIAIWQNKKNLVLIDKEGYSIRVKDISTYQGLLHIVGTDANIYAWELIKSIESETDLSKKIQVAIRYGERRWDLVFQNNLVVKMPENDFYIAWRYLEKLYSKNDSFFYLFKLIELRNSKKYYIEKNI